MAPLEYARKFQELERFAPELVPIEEKRANKYIEGLNYELQEKLEGVRSHTFEDAVDRANTLYNVQKKKEQLQN